MMLTCLFSVTVVLITVQFAPSDAGGGDEEVEACLPDTMDPPLLRPLDDAGKSNIIFYYLSINPPPSPPPWRVTRN